jgi:hypothetical protein
MRRKVFMLNRQPLIDLFSSPWVKKLPAPTFIASVLAAIIHPVLAGIGFDVAAAAAVLAKIGFQVAGELLPSIIEVAQKGISALGDWLEKEIAGRPEVNEAAARLLVEQAQEVTETLADAQPEEKAELAEAFGQGLATSGGAIAAIAEPYQAALLDAADLRALIEDMRARINTWASQTIEARGGSVIEGAEQQIKGRGGQQDIRAEDNSRISRVRQKIE